MDDELTNDRIHTLSTRFNLEVREEAAYLLWYIWRKTRAKYSRLPACISALEDEKLYRALKEAVSKRDYHAIKFWRGTHLNRDNLVVNLSRRIIAVLFIGK